MFVFGQRWFVLGKFSVIWEKVVVYGQIGCIRTKNLMYGIHKSGFIGVKVIVFDRRLLYSRKTVVLARKWL